jgi:hypothetical protein
MARAPKEEWEEDGYSGFSRAKHLKLSDPTVQRADEIPAHGISRNPQQEASNSQHC